MKKRIIIFSTLGVFVSLVLLFISSIFEIEKQIKSTANADIKSYLAIAIEVFDGESYEETNTLLNKSKHNIRLTFIDLDGKVIYDSLTGDPSSLENHLSRPELANLGVVVERDSESFGKKMLYVAALDDGVYLRVAFEMNVLTQDLINYLIFASISIIIILAIYLFLVMIFSKRLTSKVNISVNELNLLVNPQAEINVKSVDDLPLITKEIRSDFENKIQKISDETNKTNAIIEEVRQGFILLEDEKVYLINHVALDLFAVNYDDVINKSYLYLIRDLKLQEKIMEATSNDCVAKMYYEHNGRTYYFKIKPFRQVWLKKGILISFTDITENVQVEKIKRDFFANASHELKSPLTSIIGYQQLITTGIVDDKKEIQDLSQKILKEANRMNQIIIDMLELSNLEYETNYMIEAVNVRALTTDIIKRYETKLASKNITIETNLEDLTIATNASQLEILISNLIDNAFKYNKSNGKIKVILNSEELIVEDTGVGIAKEEQNRIFERFYRVDKAKSKESGGTGLGLAIVKHICERLGFSIRVVSVLDKGSSFTIKW